MINRQEAAEFLMQVLAVPSVNGRDDEGKMAEFLAAYMRKAGIEAQVDRIDATHANVTADIPGKETFPSTKTELWNGHLDTVPYGSLEDWKTDPSQPVLQDGRIYGRGASDMKSGLCAMVYALCAFHRTGRRPERTIRFIGTCDEEKGGLGALEAAKKEDMTSFDSILIAEPTALHMGMAQKGCLWLKIHAFGKTSHGAYPQQGCSALTHALTVTEKIKTYVENHQHALLGSSTANITQIQAGTAPNMIPEQSQLLMDIRFTPDLTVEKILEKAREAVALEESVTDGAFRAELEIVNSRRAIEIREEADLTERLKRCLEKTGITPEAEGINFFTDASVMAADLPDTQIMLFGPGEPSMAHKADEYVDLDKYIRSIEVYLHLLGVD